MFSSSNVHPFREFKLNGQQHKQQQQQQIDWRCLKSKRNQVYPSLKRVKTFDTTAALAGVIILLLSLKFKWCIHVDCRNKRGQQRYYVVCYKALLVVACTNTSPKQNKKLQYGPVTRQIRCKSSSERERERHIHEQKRRNKQKPNDHTIQF